MVVYREHYVAPKSLLTRIINTLLFLFTILSSATLVGVYIGSGINPNEFWPFAFLTLGLPFIMLLNLILMLYWIFRWRWFFIIPLIALMVGIGNISVFFKPNFAKEYGNEAPVKGAIKIISYNVGGFIQSAGAENLVSVVDSTLSYLNDLDADIICIQEFEANYKTPKHKIDSMLGKWEHHRTFYTRQLDESNGCGLAVYSKYPILNSGGIQYPTSTNGSLWVELLIDKDTVFLYNNHLQSMKISPSERKMFELDTEDEKMERDRLKGVMGKMRDNFMLRADQADSLSLIISAHNRRTIVCGDFNDTPMSYTYRTMKGDLVDTFQESGSGRVNTYRDLFGIFRIDYIFHSEDISSVSYRTLDSGLSDHNAVEVSLLLE